MFTKTGRCLECLFFLIFSVAVTFAQTIEYKEITAPEVKSMIDEKKGIVIHVLSKIEYDMQHITGSINIPIIHIKNTDMLPKDMTTPIVFYCMGTR
ncbi:MAG: rhodanese-like domain-containing protein [Desulfobacterales bacterium]|nr:rhodanese-like domain-containing protein [Desulfobacterales bacterium]